MTVSTPDGARLDCLLDGPGQGVPVLFCHSIGTSAALWAPQVRPLAVRRPVIRFDARGHGRSSAPPGEYTIDQLGQDALAVMDAFHATAAHVVGLSMGGLVAMWIGIHAPERVRSLVLAHTGARLGTIARWTDRMDAVRAGGMRAVSEAAMTTWFSAAFRARSPATVDEFKRTLEDTSTEGYIGCCAALRDADLRSLLARIQAPTLVIAGVQDTATTVADAEALRGAIPGATLATIDTAHLGNVERPSEFTDLVTDFLAQSQAGLRARHSRGVLPRQ
jgi:3-oxoadipate enol-lactonase